MALYIVRHAMPDIDTDAAPHLWELSEQARRSARNLLSQLPNSGTFRWVSSTERKAKQTVRELAAAHGDNTIATDDGFCEVARPHVFTPDHRSNARAYVTGTLHHGWEPHAAVITRFEAAVRRHLDAASGAHLVIASHGMAMTLWLAHFLRIRDAGQFWSELDFPDLVTIGTPRLQR